MKICDESLNLVLHLALFSDPRGFFYHERISCVIILAGPGAREAAKDIASGEGAV